MVLNRPMAGTKQMVESSIGGDGDDENPVEEIVGTDSRIDVTSLEEDLDSLDAEFEEEFLTEPNISISKQAANWIVISIHIACAFSRPAFSITGEQFMGFLALISWLIYALIIPGLIILFNRRRGALTNTDFIIIPAISLSWIISLGLLVQLLGWLFSISNPIQWWTTGYISLIATFFMNNVYYNRAQREQSIVLSFEPPSISILATSILAIIMAICGPLILNQSGENFGTMSAILFVSILPLFVNRGGVVGDYLALYSCSFSLILTHSLVSSGITGGDIQLEYFWANRVIQDGSIEIFSLHRYSTILSTQIIIPILTMWTGTTLTMTFKIIYPLIYSFAPLLLYFSYSQVFPRRTSFHAAILTPFCFQFYVSMTNMPRQGFAEIFLLTGLALLFSSDSIRMYRLRIYVVPLLVMMSLAHYGTPILLYPLLWTSYFGLLLINYIKPTDEGTEDFAYSQTSEETRKSITSEEEEEILSFQIDDNILLDEEGIATLEELQNRVISTNPLLNFRHLLFGSIFVLLWHGLAGGGVIINLVQFVVNRVADSIQDRGIIGAIFSTQPTETITTVLQPFHELTKLLYLALTLLSLPAIVKMIRQEKLSRPQRNAISLSLGSWILAGLVFTVPLLALHFEFNRVYHWILMFLAPFMIQGLEDLINKLRENLSFPSLPENDRLVEVTICCYLLLSSGFVYQLTDEDHRMALDSEVDWARFSESEEAAVIWYNSATQDLDERQCIWSDYHNSRLFLRYQGQKSFDSIPTAKTAEMLYLDRDNVQSEEAWIFNRSGFERWSLTSTPFEEMDPNPNLASTSKIYDSGGSSWLWRETCSVEEVFLRMEW